MKMTSKHYNIFGRDKLQTDNICSVCLKLLQKNHIITLINNAIICDDCIPELTEILQHEPKAKISHAVKKLARKKNRMVNRYIYDVPDYIWHLIKLLATKQNKTHRETVILALQKYIQENKDLIK